MVKKKQNERSDITDAIIEENLLAYSKGDPLTTSLVRLGPRFKEEFKKRFGEFELGE